MVLSEELEVALERSRVDDAALSGRLLTIAQRKEQWQCGWLLLEDEDVRIGVNIHQHQVRIVQDRRVAILGKDLTILVLPVRTGGIFHGIGIPPHRQLA